jgi:hypothetical protein
MIAHSHPIRHRPIDRKYQLSGQVVVGWRRKTCHYPVLNGIAETLHIYCFELEK